MRRESTFHGYHQQDVLVVFRGAELQASILDLSCDPFGHHIIRYQALEKACLAIFSPFDNSSIDGGALLSSQPR